MFARLPWIAVSVSRVPLWDAVCAISRAGAPHALDATGLFMSIRRQKASHDTQPAEPISRSFRRGAARTARHALDRVRRPDGRGQDGDRPQGRPGARPRLHRQRPRDRKRVAHDHPGTVRALWRGRVPRARTARHRARAGERSAGAVDRRRRLHERADARGDRRTRHLDLAQGRSRPADGAGRQEAEQAAAARMPTRAPSWPG